jgi:hypothetical protein
LSDGIAENAKITPAQTSTGNQREAIGAHGRFGGETGAR